MKAFAITLDDFQAAQKLHAGRRVKLLLALMIAGVGAITLGPGLLSADRALEWPNALAFAAFGVLVFYLYPILTRRKCRQIYESQEFLREEMEMAFDDRSIHWKTAAGRFPFRWEDLHGYRIGAQIILLYEAKNAMRIVPFRAFEDEAEWDRFVELLAEKA